MVDFSPNFKTWYQAFRVILKLDAQLQEEQQAKLRNPHFWLKSIWGEKQQTSSLKWLKVVFSNKIWKNHAMFFFLVKACECALAYAAAALLWLGESPKLARAIQPRLERCTDVRSVPVLEPLRSQIWSRCVESSYFSSWEITIPFFGRYLYRLSPRMSVLRITYAGMVQDFKHIFSSLTCMTFLKQNLSNILSKCYPNFPNLSNIFRGSGGWFFTSTGSTWWTRAGEVSSDGWTAEERAKWAKNVGFWLVHNKSHSISNLKKYMNVCITVRINDKAISNIFSCTTWKFQTTLQELRRKLQISAQIWSCDKKVCMTWWRPSKLRQGTRFSFQATKGRKLHELPSSKCSKFQLFFGDFSSSTYFWMDLLSNLWGSPLMIS